MLAVEKRGRDLRNSRPNPTQKPPTRPAVVRNRDSSSELAGDHAKRAGKRTPAQSKARPERQRVRRELRSGRDPSLWRLPGAPDWDLIWKRATREPSQRVPRQSTIPPEQTEKRASPG